MNVVMQPGHSRVPVLSSVNASVFYSAISLCAMTFNYNSDTREASTESTLGELKL